MNIKPLYDRVVIKRMEEEKMSAGGIVIPDSAADQVRFMTVVDQSADDFTGFRFEIFELGHGLPSKGQA